MREVCIGEHVLRISEQSDTLHHGTTIWTSGLCLAHYFARTPRLLCGRNATDTPRPLRVLELGAGTGILSIAIALLASSTAEVLATDQNVPEILDNLRRNVAMNVAGKQTGHVTVQAYDWGTSPTPTPRHAEQGWDYVLAADCVYTMHSLSALVWSLACTATARTTVLVAIERRDAAVCDAFVQQAREAGFSAQHIKTRLNIAMHGEDVEVWRLRRRADNNCRHMSSVLEDAAQSNEYRRQK